MKTLAQIHEKLTPDERADLTQIIADVTAAKRSSDAGVIADRDAEITELKKELTKVKADSAASVQTANAERKATLDLRDSTLTAIAEKGRRLHTLLDEVGVRLVEAQTLADAAVETDADRAAKQIAAKEADLLKQLEEVRKVK